MADYQRMEEQLTEALGLRRRPVAVAFRDAAPAGVMKFSGSEPSGCSFWRVAASGRSFYTVAGDHYNCPIGSYTHNLALPPERAAELEQTLFYTDLGEDELYVTVPGRHLIAIAEAAQTIAAANQTLFSYHRERRQALATE